MTDDGDCGAGRAVGRGRGHAIEPAGAHDRGSKHRSGEAALNPLARDRIAGQLRAMYASVASQPVPDRFAELIAKLDATDRARSSPDDEVARPASGTGRA